VPTFQVLRTYVHTYSVSVCCLAFALSLLAALDPLTITLDSTNVLFLPSERIRKTDDVTQHNMMVRTCSQAHKQASGRALQSASQDVTCRSNADAEGLIGVVPGHVVDFVGHAERSTDAHLKAESPIVA
jgi:hypothetical protein